jgi:hypothetical protein
LTHEPARAGAEEIDQAARAAATALRTLGELARADYSIGPALRVLDVLAAEGGPLAELCAVFANLADYLHEFEDEQADTGQLYGGSDSVHALIRRAASTLQPLAD